MLGSGIIKGMVVTARNLIGSYHQPRRLVTVQYPEQTLAAVERARTVPFLVYDGEDPISGLRCTSCTICEQECPPKCISIVKDTVKKPDYLGKMQFQPKAFAIDISVCMGCGICVEVCPFDSIKMDPAYKWIGDEHRAKFILQKQQLAKSNGYYSSVHPIEAAEIDALRAEEKRKAEAKAAAKPAAPAPPAPAPAKKPQSELAAAP